MFYNTFFELCHYLIDLVKPQELSVDLIGVTPLAVNSSTLSSSARPLLIGKCKKLANGMLKIFWLPYLTKFSTPGWKYNNFVRFVPDFCILILDKIFDVQIFSSDTNYDTKSKFRQFCPTNFCLIRYVTKDFSSPRDMSRVILNNDQCGIFSNTFLNSVNFS